MCTHCLRSVHKKKKKKKKKKASSGTSGRVAWASYHDDDPRDFGPGVAYTSRDSWPLAIIWIPWQWGRELSAPKPYETIPLQILQQVILSTPIFGSEGYIYGGLAIESSLWCAFTKCACVLPFCSVLNGITEKMNSCTLHSAHFF